MAIQIQLRRDTAAAWASANIVLASGEIGIETDTKKFKIGDGSISWNSNAYAGGTWGSLDGSMSDQTDLKTALDDKVSKSELVFNVKDYGAVGDNIADDTAAINATITACRAANGGTVYMPAGYYKITDRIVIENAVHLMGDGNSSPDGKGTVISQANATKDAVYCTTNVDDVGNVKISNIRIQSADGVTNTGGRGIFFEAVASGVYLDIMLDNILVKGFGKAGVEMQGIITSTIKNVKSMANDVGFLITGDPVGDGSIIKMVTSTNMISCYALANKTAGYRIVRASYSTMISCASDHNDLHYELNKCEVFSLNACGAEGVADTPSVKTCYWINKGVNVSLYSCYALNSLGDTIHVDSSRATIVGFNDIDNQVGSTSFTIDTGADAQIINCNYYFGVTNNGTVSVQDSGKLQTPSLQAASIDNYASAPTDIATALSFNISQPLEFYGTVDKVTNFSKFRMNYDGDTNAVYLQAQRGGTGVQLPVVLRSDFVGMTLDPWGSLGSNAVNFVMGEMATANGSLMGISGTYYADSGISKGLKIAVVAGSYGSSGSTDVSIERDGFGYGSGPQLLIDGKVAGTSKFSVSDKGVITSAGVILPQQATTAAAPTYVKGAMYFDTTLNKLRVGGASGWETITSS